MTKIRFGVVGCGNIGIRHLAILKEDPRALITAVCDSDKEKSGKISGQFGSIPAFVKYEEMIKSRDIDIVSICTPHHLHAEMAIQAAREGKHILVEKPMALTSADCKAMMQEAEKNNVRLFVVKQNRFNVPVALAREAIKNEKLGTIYLVKCDVLWNRNSEYYSQSPWRGKINKEGGALFTQVSHFIDLLVWWFGNISSASTITGTRKHAIEVEDCGSSIVHFSSGVPGVVTWTTCVYNRNYEGSITILGEKGTIKIGGQYLNKIDFWDVKEFPLPADVDFNDRPNRYGSYQGTSSNHDKVISAVISTLRNEVSETVEGYEGIKTVEAIETMYASRITI